MKKVKIQILFLLLVSKTLCSTSVIDVIRKAALNEFGNGLTKQQQEASIWVAKYFEGLPSDVDMWDEYSASLEGLPEDLVQIQAAFMRAYDKRYFEERSAAVDSAIIKYSSPIFWRVRDVVEIAPDLAATIVFHYVDAIARLKSPSALDVELAEQAVETILFNYKKVDTQVLFAIVDAYLVLNEGDLEALSRRIIREKVLTDPSVFEPLIFSAYAELKEFNQGDGLSILSTEDISTLESELVRFSKVDVPYAFKALNLSILARALRSGDWNGYPSIKVFLVKHFAESKKR